MTKDKRDSFIFYRSFHEALLELPDDIQLQLYQAISQYSLNFKEPKFTGLSKTIWILIRPQLQANNKRFANGSKPKQKQDGSETEAKPKQDASKPEANKNNNDNVNVNNNKNNNEIKSKPKKDSPKKTNYAEAVTFTEEEFEKLVGKYGTEVKTCSAIEILNNYKMSNGKKYKSDYHVMIGWVFDKFIENLPFSKEVVEEPKPLPELDWQPEPESKPNYLEAPKVNQGVAAPPEFAEMLKNLKGGMTS